MLEELWFETQHEPEIYLFSKVAPEPVQPANHWVLRPLFSDIKWLGCEVYHSPPSSTKVRNLHYSTYIRGMQIYPNFILW